MIFLGQFNFVRHKVPRVLVDPAFRKVVVAGNVVKVTSMRDPPGGGACRRVDRDTYCYQVNGELRFGVYHRAETKAQLSTDSVRRTLERLRLIINANCLTPLNLLWLTLTYAENMRDYKRLYKDFKRFWMRFKRYCVSHGLEIPEYISVAEPQNRGAWHLHLILLYCAPFVPVSDIETAWGQGFVWITDCFGVDNIGAYFSAYLSDLPFDEAVEGGVEFSESSVVEKSVFEFSEQKTVSKKFVKGARLGFYPAGMNFFRCSRGVFRPIVLDRSGVSSELWEAEKEKAGLGHPTFSKSCSVLSSSPGCEH